jgi:hypothetical protein
VKAKKGQSTIEFIFVFFAFIFFLSISYNAVVSFAVYQYMSYATFMTARAYQAARQTPADQRQAALRTIAIYVPGVTEGTQSTGFAFSPVRPLARVTAFVVPAVGSAGPFVLQFEVPFITLPLGDDIKAAFGTLTLRATSQLGREVSMQECRSFFTRKFGELGGSGPHSAADMEDNGC